jgi:hypothetical protein
MTVTLSLAALGIASSPGSCSGAPLPLSEPLVTDLWVYRGDTGRFQVAVTEADGTTPVDISAATWSAQIRLTDADVAAAAEFTIEPLAGQTHIIEVVLDAATSASLVEPSYVYDVEMTLDGEVTTLIRGTITVEGDVSRP